MTAPFLGLSARFESEGADKVVGDIRGIQGAATEGAAGVGILDKAVGDLTSRFLQFATVGFAIDMLKDFAEAGLEANRATNLLNASLKIVGDLFDVTSGYAERVARSVSDLGLSTETQATAALQRLTLVSGNAQFALKHLVTAQDLAAATGMDLERAATLLGRAYNGQWQMLERLGLVTKEQVASGGAMDALIAKTKGMTEAATEGAGAYTKLGTEIKNAFEAAAEAATKQTSGAARFLSRLLFEGPMSFSEVIGGQRTGRSPAVPMIGGLSFGGSSAFGSAFAPASPEQIALGPDEDQQKEQEKYDKLAADRLLKKQEAIKKAGEQLAKSIREANENINKAIEEGGIKGKGAWTQSPLSDALMPNLSPTAGTAQGLGQQAPEGGPMGANLNLDLAKTWKKNNLPQMTVDIPNMVQQGFDAIGSAIERGVREMNSKGGGKHMFAAISDAIVGSFGEMMSSFGKAVIAYGITLIPLQSLLSNPLSSPAAIIAIGVALEALGSEFSSIVGNSSLSGGNGGSSGYAGGVGSVSGITSRSYLTPGAGTPFAAGNAFPGSPTQHVFNFFGPNDPQVQRAFQQTMQNMVRRNQTVRGIGG